MQRVIRVLTLDMKMKGFLKGIIISLFIILGVLLLTIEGEILFLGFPKDTIKGIPEAFLSLIPYIILVNCSMSLTREFENKTDKVIFTGIFTRNEIILSKLMSFITTSLVCYVVYAGGSIMFRGVTLNRAVDGLIVIIIYAFTIGSVALFISTITSNGIITGLIIYVLHFDLTLALLGQTLESSKSLVVKRVIENSTFYIANTGFKAGIYTLQQSCVMILCGVLALLATFVIINKKNM